MEREQHCLGRLADEPELSAGRVVAEPFGRDRRPRDLQELVERDDGKLVDEILRRATCEHGEASEARSAGALEQGEPDRGIVGEDRRGACPQRGGDGALGAGGHLDLTEREPRTVFGERPCGRWKPFLLGQRLVERTHALVSQSHALRKRRPLAFRRARVLGGMRGFELETRQRILGVRPLVAGRLRAEALEESGRGLRAELQALDAALKAVPRGDSSLPASGCVRELVLGARSIGKQALQPSLGAAFREQRGIAPPFRLRAPGARLGEIELGNARAQAGDLGRELLGAFGRRGLQRKRPQALAHLVLDVASALDL